MQELYPLKFTPMFQDRVWGGQKIKTHLGLDFTPLAKCAEAWMLSGVAGAETVVENGFLAGNELNELVEVYMDDLVGEKVFEKNGETFPLLIKFIDSRQWLSVQVHPDDELARQRGMPFGKTEMWYILDTDPGSQIISGFNKNINQKVYLDHLDNKTLPEILNYVDVEAGDVVFMPAGRVHSLGPGILLAEIQQTSDATYRIYDWDRPDDSGKPREMHVEQALQAIHYEVPEEVKTNIQSSVNETVNLIDCPYFTTNLAELAQPLRKDYEELDSFVIYVCLEGGMALRPGIGEGVYLKQGEVVLIPAVIDSAEIFPEGKVKFLEVYITQ
jgi:mannose-6-phosphate isomerase